MREKGARTIRKEVSKKNTESRNGKKMGND
jgi:hypothetical protein